MRAEQSNRRAFETDSDYLKAYNNLGVILSKQRKYEDAQQAYYRAIEIDPNYGFAHYNLGILLNERRKFEDVDSEDIAALICASAAGFDDVVKLLLLDKGANIHAVDNKQRTALIWASLEGHVKVAKLLLDKGTNIHAVDYEGCSALFAASFKGHIEVVKLLLDCGADINVVDNEGRNALIWASLEGHAAVVKLLLDKGVNIHAVDNKQRTALTWASARGCTAVAKLLFEVGATADDGGQNNSTDEVLEEFCNDYQISHEADIILDKIKEFSLDITNLEQILGIYPYVAERQVELPKDKLDKARGKLKDALEEVASIPFPERKEIISEHLKELEPLKGESASPLPDPDLSGNTYPLYVKRTDPFKHLEEVWGSWLVRYTPSLKQDYLDQKQLRERDPVLFKALSNRLGRTKIDHIRDYIPPYSTPFLF